MFPRHLEFFFLAFIGQFLLHSHRPAFTLSLSLSHSFNFVLSLLTLSLFFFFQFFPRIAFIFSSTFFFLPSLCFRLFNLRELAVSLGLIFSLFLFPPSSRISLSCKHFSFSCFYSVQSYICTLLFYAVRPLHVFGSSSAFSHLLLTNNIAWIHCYFFILIMRP